MSNRNVNKVILVGNLGHEPELRYTAKGNPVTTFSLATSRGMKNAAGENEEKTYWHRATVWGKRAESCAKYLTKGSSVYLEGELQLKNWTGKDGKEHKSAEILVDDIRFLSGFRKESAQPAAVTSELPALSQ
jgi:single-strand DNA-binding protein